MWPGNELLVTPSKTVQPNITQGVTVIDIALSVRYDSSILTQGSSDMSKKQKEHLIKLNDEQLGRVLEALEYHYDTGDTQEDHDVNTALAEDIRTQMAAPKAYQERQSIEDLNKALKKHELFVEENGKENFKLFDLESGKFIGHYKADMSAQTILHVRRLINLGFQEGVQSGKKELAANFRAMIGAQADPEHEFNY